MRDKVTRESKGVAFILFLDRESAQKAVAAINKKQVWISRFMRAYGTCKTLMSNVDRLDLVAQLVQNGRFQL